MTQEAVHAMSDWARACDWHRFTDEAGAAWHFSDGGGELPVLVLLPGALGGACSAWRLAQAFEGQRRVVAVTYPGGRDALALADGLSQLLSRIGARTCAVWGSSYGAWWAQAFAQRHPHQVEALWLGNTFVDAEDLAGAPLFDAAWLEKASAAEVQDRWHQAISKRPADELRAVQLQLLQHSLPPEQFHGRLCQVATAPTLPSVDLPRTVVCDCADDPTIRPEARARVLARYPNARPVHLESGGHYPHIVAPDALIEAMNAWLAPH